MRRALVLTLTLLSTAAAPAAVDARITTLVTYERSGGIAGIDQRVVVRTDGRVTVTDGDETSRRRLSSRSLRSLRSKIAAARAADPKKRYAPDGVVSDGFTERVRAKGLDVTVLTLAKGVPPAVDKLMNSLGSLT